MSQYGWPIWQVPVVPSGHARAQLVAPFGQVHAHPLVNSPCCVSLTTPAGTLLVQAAANPTPRKSAPMPSFFMTVSYPDVWSVGARRRTIPSLVFH
jgi:hypothetical protein